MIELVHSVRRKPGTSVEKFQGCRFEDRGALAGSRRSVLEGDVNSPDHVPSRVSSTVEQEVC